MANQYKKGPNKGKITISLDQDIIDTFKHLASTEERKYQTMINKVLREYVDNLPMEKRYHDR